MGFADAKKGLAEAIANTMGEAADYPEGALAPSGRIRATFVAPVEMGDEESDFYFVGTMIVVPVADLAVGYEPKAGDKVTQDPDGTPVVWTVAALPALVGEDWSIPVDQLYRPNLGG